ncbi:MAG: hypothetical protein AAF916_09775 [Planctomycetota bacterium]
MILADKQPPRTNDADEVAKDVRFIRKCVVKAFADGVDISADESYLEALRQLEAEGVLRFERFDEYSLKLLPYGSTDERGEA